MPVPTRPWQPVIYDAMLLADAVLSLRRLGRVDRRAPAYCEHEKNLVTALSRIRNLAQFLSATGRDEYIKVTDPELGGVADHRFVGGVFDRISKYVSHLHEQRYKKESKYTRPNAGEACEAARKMLPAVENVLDRIKFDFAGDAAQWYTVFVQSAHDFERTYEPKAS